MAQDRPIVVLIGAPGSGKTKVGKRVARALGTAFVDTDRMIVAKHGPIADIFDQHGEPRFRELERIEVAEALQRNAVVSLGGGAILDARTRQELGGCRVALLTVTAEAVASRIGGAKRPLLRGGLADWQRLVEQRRPIYEQLAGRSWDTSEAPLDEVAAEIARWIEEDGAAK